jgi:hypothetical protein
LDSRLPFEIFTFLKDVPVEDYRKKLRGSTSTAKVDSRRYSERNDY